MARYPMSGPGDLQRFVVPASRGPERRNMIAALCPLPSLIRASAQDAGNANMRKGLRKAWNEDDRFVAADELDRLVRATYARLADHDSPEMCFYRFRIAEQLERAGRINLSSDIAAAIDAHLSGDE
jgi:hypothetical protein